MRHCEITSAGPTRRWPRSDDSGVHRNQRYPDGRTVRFERGSFVPKRPKSSSEFAEMPCSAVPLLSRVA